MPNGFFRSKKGEEEYAKIGKEYENTLKDTQYAAFLRKTANSPHSGRNKKVATMMIRERADDGKEYLRYELLDTRYDVIGAEWKEYCPNQGIYPIPIAQPKLVWSENMTVQETVTGDIIRYEMGYEIPFTKENINKIHDELANDTNRRNKTQYVISEYKGGKRVTVSSYEDFRDGNFDELMAYGTREENIQTAAADIATLESPKQKHIRKQTSGNP